MKWIFFIATLSLLGGCADPAADTHADEHSAAGKPSVQQVQTQESQLVLNNGEKWETDEPTRLHAQNLIAFSDTFQLRTEGSPADQLVYANAVDAELNQLVTDCKMTGKEHDALHLWLEPVIEDVKQLKQAIKSDTGSEAASRLSKDIKKFNQFFE